METRSSTYVWNFLTRILLFECFKDLIAMFADIFDVSAAWTRREVWMNASRQFALILLEICKNFAEGANVAGHFDDLL